MLRSVDTLGIDFEMSSKAKSTLIAWMLSGTLFLRMVDWTAASLICEIVAGGDEDAGDVDGDGEGERG